MLTDNIILYKALESCSGWRGQVHGSALFGFIEPWQRFASPLLHLQGNVWNFSQLAQTHEAEWSEDICRMEYLGASGRGPARAPATPSQINKPRTQSTTFAASVQDQSDSFAHRFSIFLLAIDSKELHSPSYLAD